MKIVCISDTHLAEPELPEGDVLVHAGDLTYRGTAKEVEEAFLYLATWKPNYDAVVFIAGNHDFLAERNPKLFRTMAESAGLTYLQDEGVTINGLKFWGTPWSNEFGPWAFMTPEYEQAQIYAKIPDDVDVLLSHGPPYGTFDEVIRPPYPNVGSKALRDELKRIKPKLHVFGHIHEGYGHTPWGADTVSVNASIMNVFYDPENKPVVVEVPNGETL